jgi:CubicO group peptidase (beta-lactamase class C family)
MMTRSSPEKELALRVTSAITDVTPGVVLRAYLGGELVRDVRVGDTQRYYDLASLTKIVFTQQALMQAYDQGLWHLASTVGDTLPDFSHPEIRITELLTHTSGVEWWRPFYETVNPSLGWQQRRQWLYSELQTAPCVRTGRAVYSDLGYMLLGFVLEAWSRKNLLDVWKDLKAGTYPESSLAFHLNNLHVHPVQQYAPTALCPWRHKRLQGEVHDDNTWSFGGVSTHAGLFGSIDDLASYGLQLRAQLRGLAGAKVRQATGQLFAQRAIAPEVGDWALGFMMPAPQGASCGRYFSPESIGHTGFTGTSLWYDPIRDLLVAILSNRVFAGRDNKAFLALRPQMHDWVVESL